VSPLTGRPRPSVRSARSSTPGSKTTKWDRGGRNGSH
jgi:hypothetical protein